MPSCDNAARSLRMRGAGLLAAAAAGAAPGQGGAHGAFVVARPAQAIAIEALYESGEPMAGAQVVVYAPDLPNVVFLRGTADAQGQFAFVPDGRPGRWTVQARHAGHGAIAHVETGPPTAGAGKAGPEGAAAAPVTAMQRLAMAASVIWGLVGTALFFHRRAR